MAAAEGFPHATEGKRMAHAALMMLDAPGGEVYPADVAGFLIVRFWPCVVHRLSPVLFISCRMVSMFTTRTASPGALRRPVRIRPASLLLLLALAPLAAAQPARAQTGRAQITI